MSPTRSAHSAAPARRHSPLRGLLLVAALAAACPAAALTGFSLLTPERLWDLAQIADPQVSPDGRYVVFTVTGFPRGSDVPAVDLWLVEADGGGEPRQLTRNPGPDLDPAWSPDSRSIAYASSRPGEASTDIYLLNLRGGEPLPLSRFPTDARRPRFRADGTSVIFEAATYPDLNDDLEALALRVASTDRARTAAAASEARMARHDAEVLDGQRVSHLFEVPVGGGAPVDLLPGFERSVPHADFDWDLSADGTLLAFTGLVEAPPYRSRDRDVYVLQIEDGRRINLTRDRPGSAFRPRFDTRGGLLFGELRTSDALAEFTALQRYDLHRRSITRVTDPARLAATEWVMDRDGSRIYFTAEESGGRHIFRVGANGGKARRIVTGGDVRDLRIGPAGDLYFIASTLTRPGALRRTDSNGNHERQLTALNESLLEDTRLGNTRRMRFRGYRDAEVEAQVVLPPGFDPARRWPVLLLLHGGPHQAWLDSFYRRWNLMVFASPGYVVIAPNHHGSTGYGQTFANALEGAPLAAAEEDMLRIADQVSDLPWVDATRMAIVGGSYGGYLANWLLTRTDRFAAAVVHAGIFDLMVQYGSDHPWGRQRTYGALPWDDPGRYRELSPSSHAAAIKTPTLLLHGERDSRVPTVHSLMLHNMLTGRGVPSRLVLFTYDGHQIDRRSAALRWWREIFSWLERHAPPGPARPAP